MSYYSDIKKDLLFIGDANWDIYSTTKDGMLKTVALAKEGTGCKDSCFGDKNHIKRLISEGLFSAKPTEKGLEFLEGLYNRLHQDDKGIKFSVLTFYPN